MAKSKKSDFISGYMVSGSFSGILEHLGHKISCAYYGTSKKKAVNAAIECEDCQCVIVDFEKNPLDDCRSKKK